MGVTFRYLQGFFGDMYQTFFFFFFTAKCTGGNQMHYIVGNLLYGDLVFQSSVRLYVCPFECLIIYCSLSSYVKKSTLCYNAAMGKLIS